MFILLDISPSLFFWGPTLPPGCHLLPTSGFLSLSLLSSCLFPGLGFFSHVFPLSPPLSAGLSHLCTSCFYLHFCQTLLEASLVSPLSPLYSFTLKPLHHIFCSLHLGVHFLFLDCVGCLLASWVLFLSHGCCPCLLCHCLSHIGLHFGIPSLLSFGSLPISGFCLFGAGVSLTLHILHLSPPLGHVHTGPRVFGCLLSCLPPVLHSSPSLPTSSWVHWTVLLPGWTSFPTYQGGDTFLLVVGNILFSLAFILLPTTSTYHHHLPVCAHRGAAANQESWGHTSASLWVGGHTCLHTWVSLPATDTLPAYLLSLDVLLGQAWWAHWRVNSLHLPPLLRQTLNAGRLGRRLPATCLTDGSLIFSWYTYLDFRAFLLWIWAHLHHHLLTLLYHHHADHAERWVPSLGERPPSYLLGGWVVGLATWASNDQEPGVEAGFGSWEPGGSHSRLRQEGWAFWVEWSWRDHYISTSPPLLRGVGATIYTIPDTGTFLATTYHHGTRVWVGG